MQNVFALAFAYLLEFIWYEFGLGARSPNSLLDWAAYHLYKHRASLPLKPTSVLSLPHHVNWIVFNLRYLLYFFFWQMYASQYFSQISELLRRLPRVILLLLKTNDCLRAVNNSLVCHFFALLIFRRGLECNSYWLQGPFLPLNVSSGFLLLLFFP